MKRARVWIAVLCALFAGAAAPYPDVRPGVALHFPADHGAHPEFRTEWWYLTGWLDDGTGHARGFQITFFRTRPSTDDSNPSRFAPRQIIFAHAGLSDPALGHLLHDQRAARAGFGLAQAATGNTDIVLDAWTLKRGADGVFHAHIPAHDFALNLAFTPTQAELPEGDDGVSRKGPNPSQASYYYSVPHLRVSGGIVQNGMAVPVTGEAWLDREWSSAYLDPRAVGWDWVGLNLDDGGAAMAFRMRDAAGKTLWAGGTLRDAKGKTLHFAPQDVTLVPMRRWRSARTGADYPVAVRLSLRLPEGMRDWTLTPLFDDQELDSRAAGGPVYWEGAVSGAHARGYLELTGYAGALHM